MPLYRLVNLRIANDPNKVIAHVLGRHRLVMSIVVRSARETKACVRNDEETDGNPATKQGLNPYDLSTVSTDRYLFHPAE
jgi:hypothetical protein